MSGYTSLVAIATLFGLGVFLALGAAPGPLAARTEHTAGGGVRLVANNFSALVLRVCLYLAVLAALQILVGFPRTMFTG